MCSYVPYVFKYPQCYMCLNPLKIRSNQQIQIRAPNLKPFPQMRIRERTPVGIYPVSQTRMRSNQWHNPTRFTHQEHGGQDIADGFRGRARHPGRDIGHTIMDNTVPLIGRMIVGGRFRSFKAAALINAYIHND